MTRLPVFGRHGPASIPILIGLLTSAASPAGEGQRVDAIAAATVRANYESLHGCYRKQLARDRQRGGSLILRLTLGAADSVRSAAVAEDRLGNPEVSSCVLGWVRGWTLRGAAAAGAGQGTQLVLPIVFQAAPDQCAVSREDAAELRLAGGGRARVLLDEHNAGARLASLSLLEVRNRLPLPARAGADQVLYILEGKGHLESGASSRRLPLRRGDAVWLAPGGAAAALGELVLLQVLVPGGAEQSHLERGGPAGPAGTSSAGKRPPVAPLVVGGRFARPRRVQAGKKTLIVRPLLEPGRLAHRRFYLGLLEAPAGASLDEHQHASQAELLYVLEGEAEVSCGESSPLVQAGHAVHLAPGRPHSARVRSSLRAVQIFAPGGAEDRYLRGGKP